MAFEIQDLIFTTVLYPDFIRSSFAGGQYYNGIHLHIAQQIDYN
jgi:hypothetical protein